MRSAPTMAWGEDEAIGPDVASAGLHVSERIVRDAAAQPDLEEALEASRYASHPYSSHPKEVSPARAGFDLQHLPFWPRFSVDLSLISVLLGDFALFFFVPSSRVSRP